MVGKKSHEMSEVCFGKTAPKASPQRIDSTKPAFVRALKSLLWPDISAHISEPDDHHDAGKTLGYGAGGL